MGEKIDQLAVKVDAFIDATTIRNTVIDNAILRLEENQKTTTATLQQFQAILLRLIDRDGGI